MFAILGWLLVALFLLGLLNGLVELLNFLVPTPEAEADLTEAELAKIEAEMSAELLHKVNRDRSVQRQREAKEYLKKHLTD
jgi:hypothetical protein